MRKSDSISHMAHIFLDESGQFTKHNHEEYFVVASFTIGEPKRTAKEFRKWMSTRFPKRMRRQTEIKWSATGISNELRLRTLKHISNLDVRIRYVYLLRNNIPIEYRNEHKIKDGLLYTNVVGEELDFELLIKGDNFQRYVAAVQQAAREDYSLMEELFSEMHSRLD